MTSSASLTCILTCVRTYVFMFPFLANTEVPLQIRYPRNNKFRQQSKSLKWWFGNTIPLNPRSQETSFKKCNLNRVSNVFLCIMVLFLEHILVSDSIWGRFRDLANVQSVCTDTQIEDVFIVHLTALLCVLQCLSVTIIKFCCMTFHRKQSEDLRNSLTYHGIVKF